MKYRKPGIYLLSYETIKYFVHKDRVSALRLYSVIKDNFSGNIHLHQFKEAAKILGVKQVYKNINQLIALGVLTKRTDNWYKLTKRIDFAPSKKNRAREINLEQLKSLKFLRNLYYFRQTLSSVKYARKNLQEESKSYKSNRPGDVPVSASFIKACTYMPESIQTINKQVRRSEEFGLVSIRRIFNILYKGSLEDCMRCRKFYAGPENYIVKNTINFSLIHFSPLNIKIQ
jgi:hypothetical protein